MLLAHPRSCQDRPYPANWLIGSFQDVMLTMTVFIVAVTFGGYVQVRGLFKVALKGYPSNYLCRCRKLFCKL